MIRPGEYNIISLSADKINGNQADSYNVIQPSGKRSLVSARKLLNQRLGAITIFIGLGLSHAPHQLNVLLAIM